MKHPFALLAFLVLLAPSANAQFNGCRKGPCTRVAAAPVACSDSDATAWSNAVAAISAPATPSAAQYGYVCTLITAYKAAGVWTLLDREWLYASENATQASVDIKGLSTHSLVTTPTFTADQGYNGNGTDYIDTGYAGGANFTLNANAFGAYVRTSRTSGNNGSPLGVNDGGNGISYFRPRNNSTVLEFDDNGTAFPTLANANAQGSYILVRTSSSSITVYKNGSSIGTGSSGTIGTGTTRNWFALGYNNNGAVSSISSDQIAAIFMGGIMNGTQVAAKDAALNAYMTSKGANVY